MTHHPRPKPPTLVYRIHAKAVAAEALAGLEMIRAAHGRVRR